MKRVIAVACLAVIVDLTSHPAAQSAVEPAFEVVSIKPSNAAAAGARVMPLVGGRYVATNVTLRQLLVIAYDVSDSRIDGGPEWQRSRRFDIQAKAAEPVAGLEAMRPMLKALLADRFQLKLHTEAREMPIYALVIARDDRRLGAQIRPSTADCSKAEQELAEASATDRDAVAKLMAGPGVPCAIMPAPPRIAGSMTMRANGASMTAVAQFLTPAIGRMVEDRTGLTGFYDWELTFDRSLRPQAAPPLGNDPALAVLPPPSSPSLTTALEEQLGLKLEPARGPVEIVVIDSVALPRSD